MLEWPMMVSKSNFHTMVINVVTVVYWLLCCLVPAMSHNEALSKGDVNIILVNLIFGLPDLCVLFPCV